MENRSRRPLLLHHATKTVRERAMNALVPTEDKDKTQRMFTVGAPQPIVPTGLGGVWKLAELVHESGLAPHGLNSPQKISVAIMYGSEVGMTPMQSIQAISVINGRPTIWGDYAIGLVRGSGLCEFIHETIEGQA